MQLISTARFDFYELLTIVKICPLLCGWTANLLEPETNLSNMCISIFVDSIIVKYAWNYGLGDISCLKCHTFDLTLFWAESIAVSMHKQLSQYRFSISWPRLLPDGTTSTVNEKGVDYYNRLIDGLLAEGIQPFVTLYHWDLPQALQDCGGWANDKLIQYFNDYARLCFTRFGDRVSTLTSFAQSFFGVQTYWVWVSQNQILVCCLFIAFYIYLAFTCT